MASPARYGACLVFTPIASVLLAVGLLPSAYATSTPDNGQSLPWGVVTAVVGVIATAVTAYIGLRKDRREEKLANVQLSRDGVTRPPDSLLRVSVQRGVDPVGDAIFVSADARGNLSNFTQRILAQYQLLQVPGRAELTGGFSIVDVPRKDGCFVCFIVTQGMGIPATTAVQDNLRNCLANPRLRSARKPWIPLLGTGTAKLTYAQSLDAILKALDASGWLWRSGVDIMVSGPAEMDQESLDRLRLSVSSFKASSERQPAGV